MATDPDQLDAAIRDADPSDDASMSVLAQALANAELLVPVDTSDDSGIGLLVLHDSGADYVPAYTSDQAALGAVPEHIELRRMPFLELAGVWPIDVALALNAGSSPAGWLEGEGVRELTALPGPQGSPGVSTLAAGSEVTLGEPEEEPEALLEAVADWLRRDGRTVAAYRGVVAETGAAPKWAIGLVVDDTVDDPDAVASDLALTLAEAGGIGSGSPVEVLVIDPAETGTIGSWIRERTIPFFTNPPASS